MATKGHWSRTLVPHSLSTTTHTHRHESSQQRFALQNEAACARNVAQKHLIVASWQGLSHRSVPQQGVLQTLHAQPVGCLLGTARAALAGSSVAGLDKSSSLLFRLGRHLPPQP